jgi:hypothetical protein
MDPTDQAAHLMTKAVPASETLYGSWTQTKENIKKHASVQEGSILKTRVLQEEGLNVFVLVFCNT